MRFIKNSTIAWLFSVTGKKKLYILFLTILQAIQGASGVFYALFMKNIVNAATEHNSVLFWRWIVYIVLLILLQLSLSALVRWLKELSNSIIENMLKRQFLDQLLKKDFLQISAIHSGEWMNRLTNDTVIVANSFVELLPGITGMAVKLIAALVMISVLEPSFAIILIPVGVLLLVLTLLFRKALKRRHKEVQVADGKFRVFLQERIENMLMIRSFAAEERTKSLADEKMAEHQSARMKRNHFSNLCNFGFGGIMNGLYLFGIVWCGYGILIGTVSFGTLTAITQLIAQIQIPLANITGFIPKYFTMTASAERLMEVMRISENETPAAELSDMKNLYNRFESFGIIKGCFSYYSVADELNQISKEVMPKVFSDVNITIKKGEYVAFTGQSGCGKSTLLKILMCVYKMDSGFRFYTDDAHGNHELTSIHRRLFAYVPQGNALMNGTIAEVVSFADTQTEPDRKKIWNALRIACADEFVAALEAGIDSRLGEHGTGLSEGQMQRLSIARAIYSESPILFLDEATSALDTDTEALLLKNLRKLTNLTVVIITHRAAALTICDRILRFEGEEIVEL